MSELVPKIADIATLKGISMLLALPMLCVAYTFQTGLEISLDGSVWLAIEPDDNENLQNFKLFFIFVCKSLWISFFAAMAYGLVSYFHYGWKFPFLYVASVVLIAIALLGIFGQEKIDQLKEIEKFWFYSFIVWGVFLQTMREELDKPFNKRVN
jgi:magnesium-transporting ATPase (P-type)